MMAAVMTAGRTESEFGNVRAERGTERSRGWAIIGADRGVRAQLRLREGAAWATHWAGALQHAAIMVDERACRAPQCNRVGC